MHTKLAKFGILVVKGLVGITFICLTDREHLRELAPPLVSLVACVPFSAVEGVCSAYRTSCVWSFRFYYPGPSYLGVIPVCT